MSVTESKAKTPARTSKKTVKPAEAAALKAALEAAQIEMVPLSALVKSPLNVRTIPYPVESVRDLADTILAIGLIQNLVVHSLPDGLSSHGNFHIAVCSPGDITPSWMVVFIPASGRPFSVISAQPAWSPEVISHTLSLTARLDVDGYSQASIISILAMEGAQ